MLKVLASLLFAALALQPVSGFAFQWKKGPRTYLKIEDTDHDGVPNHLDWDADGDGVANLIDSHPLDSSRIGDDEDADGIPDHVDLRVGAVLRGPSLAAVAQEEIWKEFGVVWASSAPDSNDGHTVLRALRAIYREKIPVHLKVVLMDAAAGVRDYRKGVYQEENRAVAVFLKQTPNPDDRRFTIVHEVFHAFQKDDPAQYEEFLRISGWEVKKGFGQKSWSFREQGQTRYWLITEEMIFQTPERVIRLLDSPVFVSDYAKLGPEEMYAETGAAVYDSLRGHISPAGVSIHSLTAPSIAFFFVLFGRSI